MIKEDFYSGEPVITGSPANFSSINIIGDNEKYQEMQAADAASFGKYDYDPGSRIQPTMSINPGGYGYNTNPYQQAISPIQPLGIGAAPMGAQMSPYGNIQPTYGMYQQYPYYSNNYGYPYYGQNQMYYQQYQQQLRQQQHQPNTYHIPGINLSGEYMPPADYEDTINELQLEFWKKQQEIEAQQQVDRQFNNSYYNPYGFGCNYYGTPYYNPYQYNSINNEIRTKIKEMEDKARETRQSFQFNLSRLAHNFAGHTISDDAIRTRYEGRTVNIPTAIIQTPQEYYQQQWLSNMVPFDNSQAYRDQFAAVSREFNAVVDPNSDLETTFAKMGIVEAQWEMEDEMHRRRNGTNLYNNADNAYKHFVRQKAKERYAKEKGIILRPSNQYTNSNGSIDLQRARQDVLNSSSVLSQSATLSDDGTLNIRCNFGSHAGETYSVHNAQEAEYDQKRERFGRFLDSIPGSIYLDSKKNEMLGKYSYG